MKKIIVCFLVLVISILSLTACDLTAQNKNSNSLKEISQTKEKLILYLPNDMADGFLEKEVEIDKIEAQNIIDLLIENKALPKGVKVNSFNIEENNTKKVVIIDLNSVFKENISSTGTAGEMMLLGSVVNTMLKNYNADTLKLTCDGKILETGHNIYDYPLEFFK